jgi:hypothetical protein
MTDPTTPVAEAKGNAVTTGRAAPRQFLSYLRFRRNLIKLNRTLTDTSWWRDLLVNRSLGRVSAKLPDWAGGLPITLSVMWLLLVAMALTAAAVRAVHPAALSPDASSTLGRFLVTWEPWEPLLLGLCTAYLAAEAANWIWCSARLASIRRAMLAASMDSERTALLAEVWERGQQNSDFLQELFTLYEPLRSQLHAGGLEIHSLTDRSEGRLRGNLVGAWILPVSPRLTDVIVNAADAEVKTENEARKVVEPRLLRYATQKRSNARTRFLAQWQRERSAQTDAAGGPLTEADLKRRCDQSEKGLNYVVRRITTDPTGVTIEVDRARYGQIMRSCDYLIEEALIAAGLCADGHLVRLRGSWLLRALPARRAVMRLGAEELLREPRRRAVGVGLAAVVVTREDGKEPCLRYKRRSFRVGTYPGMYHVVPTGMYNSKTRDTRTMHDQRVHPGQVLLTEFLEELKDADDLDGFDADPVWRELLGTHLHWLFHDPTGYHAWSRSSREPHGTSRDRLARLRAAAAASTGPPAYEFGHMRIWVTGVAFDLLSLRPEVCCVIEAPAGPLTEIQLNKEGEMWFSFPSTDATMVDQLPSSTDWVRSGYAAMMLAYEAVWRGLHPQAACTPSDFGL